MIRAYQLGNGMTGRHMLLHNPLVNCTKRVDVKVSLNLEIIESNFRGQQVK